MKKIFASILIIGLAIFFTTNFVQAQCTTIQDGTLLTSEGNVITPGYDEWGYNYQSRIFNGGYCDSYRDADWCQPYTDVDLIMKWNDAWLSNKDCSDDSGVPSNPPDGKLDRHFGYPSYIGSGAWLTNHQSGKTDVNGKMRKWTYFIKIIAAPEDASLSGSVWYAADGTAIGPVIWGAFAIIQEVLNDPSSGDHGILYKSPSGPGFGQFGPE